MLIKVYRHIPSKKFDDPEAITLFPSSNRVLYSIMYDEYLENAKVWQGEGTTYLIDQLEVCDIPRTAEGAISGRAKPVYIQCVYEEGPSTFWRFYYVTGFYVMPNCIRLTLLLDTFSTYYHIADFGNFNDNFTIDPTKKPIIITRSTLKLEEGRTIVMPDEVTPPAAYTTEGIAGLPAKDGVKLVFLFKLKFLAAKSVSTEAYSIRLLAVPIYIQSTITTYSQVLAQYNKILNIYEVVSDTLGIGLECEIEELYIVPRGFIKNRSAEGDEVQLRYVSVETGQRDTLSAWAVQMASGYNYTLTGNKAAGGKLLIGSNEINLPAYYGDIKINIKCVDDLNDFDILLAVENNQPQSIKNYFQVEVARSTQETSLQLIARVFGYIQTGASAVTAAGQQLGVSMASGNPLGFLAAGNTLKSAGDAITGSVVTAATKEALPATNFKTSGFSVFFESDTFSLKSNWITWLDWGSLSGEVRQGEENLKRVGVEWYNAVGSLEECLTYPTIVQGGRVYIEAETHIGCMPLSYAQEMEEKLSGGVVLINGES